MNTYIIIKDSIVINRILSESTPEIEAGESVKLASNYNTAINLGDTYDSDGDSFISKLAGTFNLNDMTADVIEDKVTFYDSSNTASISFSHNVNSLSAGDISIDKGSVTSISTTGKECEILFDINSDIEGSDNPIEFSLIGSVTSPDVSGNAKVDSQTFYYTSGSNPNIPPTDD